jgi:hypothetical protein
MAIMMSIKGEEGWFCVCDIERKKQTVREKEKEGKVKERNRLMDKVEREWKTEKAREREGEKEKCVCLSKWVLCLGYVYVCDKESKKQRAMNR